jgi:hypothetical protein
VTCQGISFLSFSWNFVDRGADNPVILALLPISPDTCMPNLPAKPLCFLLLLLCIEFQKGACLFVETNLEVFGTRKFGSLFFLSLSLTPFQMKDLSDRRN